MTGGNNSSSQNSGMITTEMSGGGLKVTYEKQPAATSNIQVELEKVAPVAPDQPAKRSR